MKLSFAQKLGIALTGKAADPQFQQNLAQTLFNKAEPPNRHTKDFLAAYSTMPWLRAVVNKVSTSVAQVEWKVYAVRNNQGKAIRHKQAQLGNQATRKKVRKALKNGMVLEEIVDHPILDVLYGGSQYLQGNISMQLFQIYIDLVGEGFFLKERNALGVPVAIWPVPPHWVQEVPVPGNDNLKIRFGDKIADIPATEVIWTKDPDPLKPYGRGSGIATSLADELETDEYAAKHTKTWFFNRARPDIIVTAAGLQKDETTRLEQDWNSRYQGFFKSFKTHFLNREVKVHDLSQKFSDMQLTDLRKFERDMIIQVFGAPPEIFGILQNSNRATIESADFLFAKWLLVPRLERIRAMLQSQLAADFDERLIIDYENPVESDREFKLNVYKSSPWAYNIDEWRDLAGDEPLEDGKGEVHMMPFTSFPAKDFESGNDPYSAGEPEKAVKTEKALSTGDEAKLSSILNSLDNQIMINALLPVIRATVSKFGTRTMDQADTNLSFLIGDPAVNDFVETRSATRIRGLIDKTTRRNLQRTLSKGMEQGETVDSLVKRVESTFSDANKRRARVIARTESVRAANYGTNAGFTQAGIPEKEWLSSRDENVRDSHAPGTGLDGQVVLTSGNFRSPVTGAEGPHPGELGSAKDDIQCRCIVVPAETGKGVRGEKQKAAIWKSFESQRLPYERRFLAASRKAFDKQEQQVIATLIQEYE